MGRPSKFTAENRKVVLEALQVGASRNEAAAIARVGPATLNRWLDKGKDATESSPFRKFRDDVLAAEAHPKMRALGVVYRAMEDRPDIAWKFIERRVDGYAPPQTQLPPAAATQVNVMLSFEEARRPLSEVTVASSPADTAAPEGRELPTATSRRATGGGEGSD
jgi:hypothetical protein